MSSYIGTFKTSREELKAQKKYNSIKFTCIEKINSVVKEIQLSILKSQIKITIFLIFIRIHDSNIVELLYKQL